MPGEARTPAWAHPGSWWQSWDSNLFPWPHCPDTCLSSSRKWVAELRLESVSLAPLPTSTPSILPWKMCHPKFPALTSPLDSDSLGRSHTFLIRQRKWWDVSDNSLGDLKRGCTGGKIYHDFLFSLSFFFGIDLEKKEELRIHLGKTLPKD